MSVARSDEVAYSGHWIFIYSINIIWILCYRLLSGQNKSSMKNLH